LRDPHGFATKFYTSEGNWDLVGNNFPTFFIRDAIKFSYSAPVPIPVRRISAATRR